MVFPLSSSFSIIPYFFSLLLYSITFRLTNITFRLTKVVHQVILGDNAPFHDQILGFLFGGVTWLRNLILGDNAPLGVIEDTIQILGNGTISCITILLGGNLSQGIEKLKVPWLSCLK